MMAGPRGAGQRTSPKELEGQHGHPEATTGRPRRRRRPFRSGVSLGVHGNGTRNATSPSPSVARRLRYMGMLSTEVGHGIRIVAQEPRMDPRLCLPPPGLPLNDGEGRPRQ
jgi:hypothetical protein